MILVSLSILDNIEMMERLFYSSNSSCRNSSNMGLDSSTIITALLHDVVEDSAVTIQDIKKYLV